ncbi:MAG: fumarylacetoacetate hydrolase family protein [candidate division WOR-3 bacterium]|nr:MAG: fumarylacetoacetate hydrolase family protein [candidate division WOR-3 bacterium]
MKSDVPAEPTFFLKPPSSLLAHGGAVVLPAVSRRVEYEVELAVIVGDRIKGIAPEDVKSAILGYTVIVDVTARDIQTTAKEKGMPWTIAKGYDTFAPVGPRIAAPEALDPSNLDIWLAVNGDMKQRGNTNQMVFDVEELVSYISHIMTLEPMDVVATGTPSGVGPLRDGDTVEAGIDQIGILRFNTVRER